MSQIISMRQAVTFTLAAIIFIGAVAYLTQAVEPKRKTAVEVLAYDELVR